MKYAFLVILLSGCCETKPVQIPFDIGKELMTPPQKLNPIVPNK